jgi:hypothetical protein
MPREELLQRVRGEYLEMPGLCLTPVQAQRLCGIELIACKAVLDALVETRFLCTRVNGAYVRVSDR